MDSKQKTLFILLLLVTFFKGIVWSAFVPIWQFADEQAHFAQVQWYAEQKKPITGEADLSFEVFESERLLGTLRDDRGINQYTYHPEFNIEYTDNSIGIYEDYLKTFPRESRTTYVKREAARYPPLFYILSVGGYLLGENGSLFDRVIATRLISVMLSVLIVWVSFLFAKSLFPKQFILPLSIAALVSFQPMLTFVTSGINNDTLLILISTAFLYLLVETIRKGLDLKRSMLMGIMIGIGILTKQLFYPFIALPIFVIIYQLFSKKLELGKLLFLVITIGGLALLFGGSGFALQFIQSGRFPFWPKVNEQSPMYALTFWQYLEQKVPQLYRETLPWYWGVFKWLGVVLPRNVLRSIKVVLLLSGFGLIKYTIDLIRKKKLGIIDWQIGFSMLSIIWYSGWLLFWDYSLIRSIGFSHGLQGRNFFPVIVCQMTLIVFGISRLIPRKKDILLKMIIGLAIVLQSISQYTFLSAYFDTSSLKILITEASQYKPWYIKDMGLAIPVTMYLTVLLQFIYQSFSYKKELK